MIQSMTGFGRAAFDAGGVSLEVEVRSVNHRFLDLRVRLPRALADAEAEVRARVQARLARGKVDVVVGAPGGGALPQRLDLDLELAAQYLRAADELSRRHGLESRLDARSLLGLPGVARFAEPELPGETRAALLRAADEALGAVETMRRTEGEVLEREIAARLLRVSKLAEEVAARAGEVQEAARTRLRRRAEQLARETGLYDQARLHQEVVIAADRLDVTEETVRLRSHVDQFRAAIAGAGPGRPAGRRLEFLLQEMARETNTVGSKAGDAPLAHFAVELKTELERIREQVQNVE